MYRYSIGEAVEVRWIMLGGPVWIPATVVGVDTELTTCTVDRNGVPITADFRPNEIRAVQYDYGILGAHYV